MGGRQHLSPILLTRFILTRREIIHFLRFNSAARVTESHRGGHLLVRDHRLVLPGRELVGFTSSMPLRDVLGSRRDCMRQRPLGRSCSLKVVVAGRWLRRLRLARGGFFARLALHVPVALLRLHVALVVVKGRRVRHNIRILSGVQALL